MISTEYMIFLILIVLGSVPFLSPIAEEQNRSAIEIAAAIKSVRPKAPEKVFGKPDGTDAAMPISPYTFIENRNDFIAVTP